LLVSTPGITLIAIAGACLLIAVVFQQTGLNVFQSPVPMLASESLASGYVSNLMTMESGRARLLTIRLVQFAYSTARLPLIAYSLLSIKAGSDVGRLSAITVLSVLVSFCVF
jgi:hypothetical protein